MEEAAGFVETQVNVFGWAMCIFAVAVLYGGLAFCLYRAAGYKVHLFTEKDEVVDD